MPRTARLDMWVWLNCSESFTNDRGNEMYGREKIIVFVLLDILWFILRFCLVLRKYDVESDGRLTSKSDGSVHGIIDGLVHEIIDGLTRNSRGETTENHEKWKSKYTMTRLKFEPFCISLN